MIYEYKGRQLNIPDKFHEEYQKWTGTPLLDSMIDLYLEKFVLEHRKSTLNDFNDEEVSFIVIKAMQGDIDAYIGMGIADGSKEN